jgi:hypothetical protein
MIDMRRAITELRTHLGYKSLNRTCAKVEILLGLSAAGGGLLLGNWALLRVSMEVEWGLAIGGLALFVLGGYLALAGHRSHLYQSGNERTAYLAEILHSHERKRVADEPR